MGVASVSSTKYTECQYVEENRRIREYESVRLVRLFICHDVNLDILGRVDFLFLYLCQISEAPCALRTLF